ERFEDAISLGRKAAEIGPNVAERHVFLGTALARTARHEEAVTAFRKVVELKGWQYTPELLLAQKLAAGGARAEATAGLATAAARDPDNVYFPLEAGKLYRSLGKPEEAARAFEKAAPRTPGLPWAWEGLAAARLDQGRFAEARAATERLLELSAKD